MGRIKPGESIQGGIAGAVFERDDQGCRKKQGCDADECRSFQALGDLQVGHRLSQHDRKQCKPGGCHQDPGGKIEFEDRIHPVIYVPHIILQVEKFTEHDHGKPADCEDFSGGPHPPGKEVCQRQGRDSCCSVPPQNEGDGDEKEQWHPDDILSQVHQEEDEE